MLYIFLLCDVISVVYYSIWWRYEWDGRQCYYIQWEWCSTQTHAQLLAHHAHT